MGAVEGRVEWDGLDKGGGNKWRDRYNKFGIHNRESFPQHSNFVIIVNNLE